MCKVLAIIIREIEREREIREIERDKNRLDESFARIAEVPRHDDVLLDPVESVDVGVEDHVAHTAGSVEQRLTVASAEVARQHRGPGLDARRV